MATTGMDSAHATDAYRRSRSRHMLTNERRESQTAGRPRGQADETAGICGALAIQAMGGVASGSAKSANDADAIGNATACPNDAIVTHVGHDCCLRLCGGPWSCGWSSDS